MKLLFFISKVPTWQQLQFLVINGVIGTVFSELLWLWGCFLTSRNERGIRMEI